MKIELRGLTSSFYAALGPYTLEYTSNGRYMIVGGRKGHIGMMDMLSMDLIKEFQVSLQYFSSFPACWIFGTHSP
uniref:Uncharacterized protein n=1 Tax=Aegilops tauschii subsp. strangulata TaxID=200361 RepID=A0A453HD77_AEGTS